MSLKKRFKEIESIIEKTCRESGRSQQEIHLLAVSKQQPVELIEEAFSLGIRDFGENYVQELQQKYEKLSHLKEIRWHLIGPLQTNKVKTALKTAHYFHALDSEKILHEVAKRNGNGVAWPVFIQVNIDDENSKCGLPEAQVSHFLERALATPQVKVQGLMCIPQPRHPAEQMATAFQKMSVLSCSLSKKFGIKLELSMGMSEDFHIAIAQGAHWVRIGRRLFGERRYE